jgi:hypothetical protein
MPVHPKFAYRAKKPQKRRAERWELNPEKSLSSSNAGWAAAVNIPQIF